MRPQPLICVRNVEASSRWYQRLLNCQSAHGGPNYERLVFSGELVLQLHRWEVEHHHGRIGDPNDLPPGNGLLLWFEVDDFDVAIARVEASRAALGRNLQGAAEVGQIMSIASMPTGRFTTPEEVATLVALLASPRTANVTGSNYIIDGGLIKTM